ncbi:MAG: EI24 domain-containing protein [Campylobacteraceae bacterium]|jgi:hypothetical protein|nr:EI24 domain-containing protein [Campylobacteraceae bacterium]
MNNTILAKSFKDFFSPKFLALSFTPLIVALVVLSILMFIGVSEIVDIIREGAKSGDFSFIDESSYPIITKILSFAVVHWIIAMLFYTFGIFLVIIFSIIIAVLTLGFLTPYVVKVLHTKHYSHLPLPKDTLPIPKMVLITVFIFIKFLALLLICLPIIFVPVLHLTPFYYLFHKLITFDVASSIFSASSYNEALRSHGWQMVFITLCFFVLMLIPVIGLFLQLFFVIYLTHYLFSKIAINPILETKES